MANVARVDRLVLALNRQRYEVAAADLDPSTTLLEFIRTRTPFRGPKLGCGEGGCGACVVLIAKYNPATDDVTQFSANSCLTLVYSLNFCSIITTEGLGNTRDGFHSIQKRMAGFHASQCGFCTPGMCMSIFSSLVAADNSKRQKPTDGFSKLKISEAESAFSGNLCRCTGYRPIVDACKSFASDVDLEDLGLNIFWKKGDKKADVSKLPSYTDGGGICIFPDFLISEIKSLQGQQNVANSIISVENRYHPRLSSNTFCGGVFSFLNSLKSGSKLFRNHPNEANITVSEECWYHPTSIKEYKELINSTESSFKVVIGNTSAGVYKDDDIYNKYIDISGIQELSSIVMKAGGIEIGAATTISRTIEILLHESKSISSPNGGIVFRKVAEHMSKVASPFVRNTASLGGNIVLAQKNQFPSDIATILLGVGSTVCLQDVGELRLRHITLEEFLQQPPLNPTTLLISIFVPHWFSEYHKEERLVFQTYRAASRPLGNAISYVNSSFLGHVCFEELTGELALCNLHLAFGAYGTEHAIRARKVEQFLMGKPLTASRILGAIQLLRKTVVPMKGTLHAEYRISVAVGFLFSFLSPLAKGMAFPRISELPLSSRQETIYDDEHKPIGEPTKKYGVEVQASGEAVYVDDVPTPKNCLHGEFIYSTKALAYVKNIKFKSSLAYEKIITVVSAKDIPKNGQNIGSMTRFGDESLFGDPITEFAGQALGVIIAETQRYADMAAKQVIVEYETVDLNAPILTMEQAVENNSYFEVPSVLYPKQVGDFSKGMAEADHKIMCTEVC